MERIVSPPSSQLIRAANLLSEGVGHFLNARDGVSGHYACYESSHDSLNLFYLSLRHIEALTCLAKLDAVLLPAAMSLARTALESSVRSLWLVDADDPYERECRWLGLIDEEIRSRSRAAKHQESRSVETAEVERRIAEHLSNYRNKILACMPEGYKVRALPNFEDLLAATKADTPYSTYIVGSQYAHGTSWALSLFRTGLGASRNFLELRSSEAWADPLLTCASVLRDTGCRVLLRLGVPADATLPKNYSSHLSRAIAQLAPGAPPSHSA